MRTEVLLGIPDVVTSFSGIDVLGDGCRIDPSVSVMRFGHRHGVVCLSQEVSLYAHNRLVVGDVAADSCVGIRIGARTIVNVGCYLSGEGGLDIGADVLIGAHAKLLSAGHAIDEGDAIIARNQITRGRIVVEDGAWIGAGAIVLEGVRIGHGAVVAAGALVRKDVPAGMVAAGMPARLVRLRRSGQFSEPVVLESSGQTSWLRRAVLRMTSGLRGTGQQVRRKNE